MPVQGDISTATEGSMETAVDDIEIETKTTDGVTALKETRFENPDWTKYYGMYKTQPELKIALDTLGYWVVGKGYKTPDAKTEIILESIRGCGVDTFDTILWNQVVTCQIGGDSYAEIIRSEKHGQLTNLRPIDPGSMVVIMNKQGIIIRYEQITKIQDKKHVVKFMPNEIFHLTNKRIADNGLGTSTIEALQEIIKANNESFEMQKKVARRFGVPRFHYHLSTDNQTKIDNFKSVSEKAVNKGESVYMSADVAKAELIAVPSQATQNILPWREHLNSRYWQVTGIPQVVVGSSGEFVESTAKVAYVSYIHLIRSLQRIVMTQLWNQLQIRIELELPFEFRNELITDEAKDGAQGMEQQPSEMTVGQESGT